MGSSKKWEGSLVLLEVMGTNGAFSTFFTQVPWVLGDLENGARTASLQLSPKWETFTLLLCHYCAGEKWRERRKADQERHAGHLSPQLWKQDLSSGLWVKQVLWHSNLVGSYIFSQRYRLSSFFYILSSFSFMSCYEALNHKKERQLIMSHSDLVHSQYQSVSYVHSCDRSDHLLNRQNTERFSFHVVL